MKEGVLYDLAGKTAHHDRRERTVIRMQQMYHVDLEQAGRVFDSAEQLLAQIGLYERDEQAREYLEWASGLHEIGLAIAHGGHQKFGAWLVQNSDMPGFTRREQATLSFLIQNQRKSIARSTSDYGITEDWMLVVIFRLAVLFNRSRVLVKTPKIGIKLRSKSLRVTLPSVWLNEHPLTHFDLEREATYWKSVGIQLSLIES